MVSLLMDEVKVAVDGGSTAASCGVLGWLDLDFFQESCSSYFKSLLFPSNVRKWPGHRVEKDHLSCWPLGLLA